MGSTENSDEYFKMLEDEWNSWNSMSKKLQWYITSDIQSAEIEGYTLGL